MAATPASHSWLYFLLPEHRVWSAVTYLFLRESRKRFSPFL